jgi:DNA-directed RNA polymerase subunit RPC12/RpoP
MATDPNGCLRCGTELHFFGKEQFRVGGTSGGWKLLFGEWAEVSEEMLTLEMYACPRCRKVELRVPAEG